MKHSTDSSENSSTTLMTKADVAKKLQVGEVTVWRYMHLNENPLPHLKVGRLVRFRLEDVEAWIAANIIGGLKEGN